MSHANRRRALTQPQVLPEAPSWCISGTGLQAWQANGLILEKAHRVTDLTDRFHRVYHRPLCGTGLGHPADECEPAPAGWPACRHCSKRPKAEVVPAVFYGLGPAAGL